MDKITKIHTIFEEGAKVMLRLFCNRCYKDLGEKSFDTHNSGNIRKLLLGPNNIDISLINNWINDLEHGLFHGIMGCLVLFLHDETLILKLNNVITNYQTNPHELEILFASILLHDFYRSAHNISENHDNLLSQYFPY